MHYYVEPCKLYFKHLYLRWSNILWNLFFYITRTLVTSHAVLGGILNDYRVHAIIYKWEKYQASMVARGDHFLIETYICNFKIFNAWKTQEKKLFFCQFPLKTSFWSAIGSFLEHPHTSTTTRPMWRLNNGAYVQWHQQCPHWNCYSILKLTL